MRLHLIPDPDAWLAMQAFKDNRRVRLERRTALRRARWAAKQGSAVQ